MAWRSSSRSLACLHSAASPTDTGTMCVVDGITGRLAAARRRFSVAARSWWRTRSSGRLLTWRTLASAAAAMAGGSDVVKMKPEPQERTKSTVAPAEAMLSTPTPQAVALRDAGTARAVHAHRMDLVEIGEGAMAVRGVAQGADRRDVAVHRVDRFEGHDLGRPGIGGGQQLLEMGDVVVAEDLAYRAGGAGARA